MPPGPAFNWLCVAQGVVDILAHAAQIRAAQASRCGVAAMRNDMILRKRTRDEPPAEPLTSVGSTGGGGMASNVVVEDLRLGRKDEPAFATATERTLPLEQEPMVDTVRVVRAPPPVTLQEPSAAPTVHTPPPEPPAAEPSSGLFQPETRPAEGVEALAAARDPEPRSPILPEQPALSLALDELQRSAVTVPNVASEFTALVGRKLQSSKVPSSRVGRLFHYGGLAASLGYGAASELLRRSTSDSGNAPASLMLTEGNVKRLVSKLTQLRGAALKLGQFMSIQDSHVLPPEIEDIFRRVQDSAHYMPDWQMEDVLRTSIGPSWADHFESFDRLPFAAASIGQVHSAVLTAAASPTGEPARVAVKIQFPNIASSIDSDLGYVKMLLTAGRLLPKGLFLDKTIQVMKEELADECDYSREASFLRRFGESACLGDDPHFKVPWVWAGSTDRVLVMEHVEGVSVGGASVDALSQQDRNDIAARIIDLCLRELFVFRAMQTDPNWSNFLWNPRTRQIELVDFGATREYSKEFIDSWLHLLQAAAADDWDACIEWSRALGYLTGGENEVMLDAHVQSMALLATPFKASTPQPFTFGPGSQWTEITARIREQIPVMLAHRLTPPPRETYSLNRKLSGSFLLAARLNASVDCKALWDQVVKGYQFGPVRDTPPQPQ